MLFTYLFSQVLSAAESVEKSVYIKLFQDDGFVIDLKQKIIKEIGDKKLFKKEEFDKYQDKNRESISKRINYYLSKNTKSLFRDQKGSTELRYYFYKNELRFTTPANYYTSSLECKGKSLDFDILTVSNFGLRGYYIKPDSCEIREVGSFNTAYYSVAYDYLNGLVAYSIPGHYKIDIYSFNDWKLIRSIKGFAATSVEFHQGDLFFAGYEKDASWKKASVYQYSIDKSEVIKTYYSGLLADVRGLSFYDDIMAVANGIHNNIYLYDLNLKKRKLELTGFHYPNGIHLADEFSLFVADEHSNYVRKIDLRKMEESWNSPAGQLKSPGSVHEIRQGKWKGYLLISDTDNNRLIIVEPVKWDIVFEISGIRSSLKSIPVHY